MKNKTHSTNYFDTFILVAEDCPISKAEIPERGQNKTVALMQFEMIVNNPYKFTSDDIIFGIYAERNNITETDRNNARIQFFSKGLACFRSSPLKKRYA